MPCHTRGSVAEASEGPGAGTTPDAGVATSGASARRAAGRRPVGLLLAKHRVLQALGETELAHALGRDLERLARLRVATDARLAVGEHQLAESGQYPPVLRFLAGQTQRLVEELGDLLLREAG